MFVTIRQTWRCRRCGNVNETEFYFRIFYNRPPFHVQLMSMTPCPWCTSPPDRYGLEMLKVAQRLLQIRTLFRQMIARFLLFYKQPTFVKNEVANTRADTPDRDDSGYASASEFGSSDYARTHPDEESGWSVQLESEEEAEDGDDEGGHDTIVEDVEDGGDEDGHDTVMEDVDDGLSEEEILVRDYEQLVRDYANFLGVSTEEVLLTFRVFVAVRQWLMRVL